jgi:DNA-binding NarL/FixJ family response regulator
MSFHNSNYRLPNPILDPDDSFFPINEFTGVLPEGSENGIVNLKPRLRAVQIVERQEFMRGCLNFWLRDSSLEVEVISGPRRDRSDSSLIERVSAVVVAGHTLQDAVTWFEAELAWLGERRTEVPIVAVVSDDMVGQAEDWIERFGLRGLILDSSSTEVASAVLRLVMAGGTHFPRSQPRRETEARTTIEPGKRLPEHHLANKLTMRERAVVHHLGEGHPNKIIARELNMSLSTVKAHMHSIIQKLNVKNRTEVAVAARAARIGN